MTPRRPSSASSGAVVVLSLVLTRDAAPHRRRRAPARLRRSGASSPRPRGSRTTSTRSPRGVTSSGSSSRRGSPSGRACAQRRPRAPAPRAARRRRRRRPARRDRDGGLAAHPRRLAALGSVDPGGARSPGVLRPLPRAGLLPLRDAPDGRLPPRAHAARPTACRPTGWTRTCSSSRERLWATPYIYAYDLNADAALGGRHRGARPTTPRAGAHPRHPRRARGRPARAPRGAPAGGVRLPRQLAAHDPARRLGGLPGALPGRGRLGRTSATGRRPGSGMITCGCARISAPPEPPRPRRSRPRRRLRLQSRPPRGPSWTRSTARPSTQSGAYPAQSNGPASVSTPGPGRRLDEPRRRGAGPARQQRST